MLLLSNTRVILFALSCITLPNNHLTQIFRRQIALVLSLRTNGADHQHILLVDDVITSGATLVAAAKELLKGTNVKISVLSLGFANND